MVLRASWWTLCILGIAISLSGCGDDHDTSANSQPPVAIVPGVSIDALAIGESFADVTEHYGTPDTKSAQLGYVMVGWEQLGLSAGGADSNLNGEFDANESCQGLAASTPYAGKTAKGIGVGSTREAVRTAYGAPDDSSATNDKYLTLGIGFIYEDAAANAPVVQVVIFPAGSTVPATSSMAEEK